VVIEAMKMEHAVRAPAAGVIAEACVQAGQPVAAGARLARIEPEEDGPAAAPASPPPAQPSPAPAPPAGTSQPPAGEAGP
jgi:pyruvate/2-oxoglutarate dehydrogenase complex dihydrolipoamide acyltransferase (E2) component